MYLTVGHFKFKPEGSVKAIELMNNMQTLGRTEPGIHQYTFYPNPDVEQGYFLFEEWESKELHDQHFNKNEMQNWLPEFFELLVEPPSVSYFDATLSSKL